MIRFLFLRFLLPLLVFFLIRSVLKSVLASFRSYPRSPAPSQQPSVPAGGELKKDPVCGTYVSTASGITRTVNGEVVYFCSSQCRDKYKIA